jgi:hypothetical protein
MVAVVTDPRLYGEHFKGAGGPIMTRSLLARTTRQALATHRHTPERRVTGPPISFITWPAQLTKRRPGTSLERVRILWGKPRSLIEKRRDRIQGDLSSTARLSYCHRDASAKRLKLELTKAAELRLRRKPPSKRAASYIRGAKARIAQRRTSHGKGNVIQTIMLRPKAA